MLLELAAWCRQRLAASAGGATCPTDHDDQSPPAPNAAQRTAPVWAHLPADRQRELRDLLARLHAASARKEVGRE